nr:immunoglobulin light chain junction region [Mus musculus]NSL99197.1 immunoglobulin light chain junction region [Mus musculus]NSM01847.1 immunoglobulin light chain junction region [Mus musculus]NSM01920.1 immunoglobulin light chain junction region [Mus musculus]
CHQWSSYPWTF